MNSISELLALIAAILGVVTGVLGVIQGLLNRHDNSKVKSELTVAPSDITSEKNREISEIAAEAHEGHSQQQ